MFKCVVPENVHSPPTERNGNFNGGWGRKFPRGWGWFLEVFCPGIPSKINKLSKTNSCSVEQAVSYFAVNGLLKQKLLYSSMIFYLRSAAFFYFFFHGLRDK